MPILIFHLDPYDSYIVVSFSNATLVLSIGETVEEVADSGFLGTTPTLSCSQLGDDGLLQVCHCFLRDLYDQEEFVCFRFIVKVFDIYELINV